MRVEDRDTVELMGGKRNSAFYVGSDLKPKLIAFLSVCLMAALSEPGLEIDSASAASKGPVQSLMEIREHNVVVQKFDLSCGAAALATLLTFQFGDHISEKEVTAGLIRRPEYIEHPELVRIRQGFSLLDMKRYINSRGYKGVGYGNLEMNDLVDLAPMIVAVSSFGYNHFVIFKGVIGDKVALADPAYGNRTMSREKFEQMQINFPEIGKVGFIVTRDGNKAPPGQLLVTARDLVATSGDHVRQLLRF